MAPTIMGHPMVRHHATGMTIPTAADIPIIMVQPIWAVTGVAMEDTAAEDAAAVIAAKTSFVSET
jgi:hypothetical protein